LVFQIALEQIADLPQAEFDTAIKLILHMGKEDLSAAWSAAVVDIRERKTAAQGSWRLTEFCPQKGEN
jgi:hypothetical protein